MNLKAITCCKKHTGMNTLHKVLCEYESQQKIVCDGILNFGESDTRPSFGHSNFVVITYLLESVSMELHCLRSETK